MSAIQVRTLACSVPIPPMPKDIKGARKPQRILRFNHLDNNETTTCLNITTFQKSRTRNLSKILQELLQKVPKSSTIIQIVHLKTSKLGYPTGGFLLQRDVQFGNRSVVDLRELGACLLGLMTFCSSRKESVSLWKEVKWNSLIYYHYFWMCKYYHIIFN